MLGIWEYFWDLVDWGGGVRNICRVTGLMGQTVSMTGLTGSVREETGQAALLHNETGKM